MQELEVYERTAFGVVRYYPANQFAEQLAKLLKQKAFMVDDMQAIHDLGFTVKLTTDPKKALAWLGDADQEGDLLIKGSG
jgi:hypothetical protein